MIERLSIHRFRGIREGALEGIGKIALSVSAVPRVVCCQSSRMCTGRSVASGLCTIDPGMGAFARFVREEENCEIRFPYPISPGFVG